MRDNEFKARLRSHGRNMKNSIDSPFDITQKIDEMEMSDMTKKTVSFNWLKNVAYSAAALAVAFVLTFNCIPSLAYAASDIPILGDIVRVVTFGRFEVQEENYDAKVNVPKIEGLLNKDLENKLNKELADNANTIITAFENDIKQMEELYGDKNFHLTLIDNLITIADVIRGDVNQDRRVDPQDELLLSRYIAKWNITFNENQMKAANVFADSAGKINSKDGVRLSQILSGYEIVENEGISLMSTKEINLTLPNIEASAGEYISVPVVISENEGIAGFNLTLNYDKEYLIPVSISKGEMLSDGNFTSNLTDETDAESLEYVTAYWNCAYNMTDNGELFIVEFQVKDNVEVGQTLSLNIKTDEDIMCDSNLNSVNVINNEGSIKITNPLNVDEPEDIPSLMPYEIGNISMITDEGTVCDEMPINGNFDLEVSLYSTTTDFNPAIILVAAYNENGTLMQIKYSDVLESTLSDDGKTKIHIDTTDMPINHIKTFVWNSLNGMVPLSDRVDIYSN